MSEIQERNKLLWKEHPELWDMPSPLPTPVILTKEQIDELNNKKKDYETNIRAKNNTT